MKIGSASVLFFCLMGLVLNAYGADTGVLNLVSPVVPPPTIAGVSDGKGGYMCAEGLTLHNNGQCCPPGTSNKFWDSACTPPGLVEGQMFSQKGVDQYCPSADMFIVSDKNNKWFSCADSNSTVLYPLPDKPEAYKFCLKHGYGYLIKIQTWKDVGCITYGDSQGDGCIEAGTCSYGE